MIVRFVFFVFFWSSRVEHLVGAQSTKRACDSTVATIDCNNKFVKVSTVTYEQVTDCSSRLPTTPPCNSSNTALDFVRTACDYKSSCSLISDDITLKTQCSGKMALEITYSCVSGLTGNRYPTPLVIKKSSAQIGWQKHPDEKSSTKYCVQRRRVSMSQQSAVVGLLFEGFGYVKFEDDYFDGGKDFTTKLSFQTLKANGTLFIAFEDDWSEYTYIILKNGFLEFTVRQSSSRPLITVKSAVGSLNDGKFHAVEAQKIDDSGIKVTVDGNAAMTNYKDDFSADVHNNVYLGGVAPGVSSDQLPQVGTFIGCINVEELDDDSSKKFDSAKNVSYANVRWKTNGCPPAIQLGIHFRGAGFVKVSLTLSASSVLQFGLRVRTSWSNGLLLAAYSDDRSAFLFVETRSDGIDLRYSGPGVIRLRPVGIQLCDGAWHTVNVSMGPSFVNVTIDDVTEGAGVQISNFQAFTSDIEKNVYLGGVGSRVVEEVAYEYGVNATSFGGCLADLTVNGVALDAASVRSDSENVSFAGCPDFSWNGPTCEDQLVNVGSEGKGEESLTDNNVEAFTEYLYRVLVQSGSGGIVFSEWIVVRTGEDESPSQVSAPVIEYDGSTTATIKWDGPPVILDKYNIKIYKVYPGTTVPTSTKEDEEITDAPLPYQLSDVSPSTMYLVEVSITVGKSTITSGFSSGVTTKNRECRRYLYRGTYYRGTKAVSENGTACLNWSTLGLTYSNLVALYPEAGLGNHSYCRNPISENRTRPWCYTGNSGGCLTWSYCDIETCQDKSCYSRIDKGHGYRGATSFYVYSHSSGDYPISCSSWNTYLKDYPVSQYGDAGLGDHNQCRNPDPTRDKPWCYSRFSSKTKRDCSIAVCNDVQAVTYVCGGTSTGSNPKCVFPFIYKSKTFFECTSFERGIPWCSTKNDNSGTMAEWSYCLCPKPNTVPQPTYSTPLNGILDGTCLPTTPPPTTPAATTPAATTSAVTTPAATTLAATTELPTTIAPSTLVPTTESPTTESPTTKPLTTKAPATVSPTTSAPTTLSSSTLASLTTSVPTTAATSTRPPTTDSLAASTATSTSQSPTTGPASTASLTTNSPTTAPAASSLAPTTNTPTSTAAAHTTITQTTMPASTTLPSTLPPTTKQPITQTESASNSSSPTITVTTESPTTVTAAASTSPPATNSPTTASTGVSNSPPMSPSSSNRHTTASSRSAAVLTTNVAPSSFISSPQATTKSKSPPETSTSNVPSNKPTGFLSTVTTTATANSSAQDLGGDDGKSLYMFIGIGAGGGCLLLVVVVVVVVVCRKRRNSPSSTYDVAEKAHIEIEMMLPAKNSDFATTSPFFVQNEGADLDVNEYRDPIENPTLQKHSSQTAGDFEADEYNDPSTISALQKNRRETLGDYAVTTFTSPPIVDATVVQNKDNDVYEAPVPLEEAQARLRLLTEAKQARSGSKEEIYWEPAKTVDELYGQLTGGKFRVLERSAIKLEKVLGTGQFGSVDKGVWKKDSKSSVVVAVKTLKSESKESRVKFLREAAIMGQFKHRNIVMLHGVVLAGKPLMVVLEILPKGDLKQHLISIAIGKNPPGLAEQFLRMARDIAAGMGYLAKLSFIHRDLAARNILLDENVVCKIADFGLSRDLADENYYITKGGEIPIRWTAPEALNYRKYSSASDVWSYGIVLYEIWTVGKRPYGYIKNRAVVERVDRGIRLPPPPGCSRAIYKLMIDCWNPDHHKRPTFNSISTRLSEPDNVLLVNAADAELMCGELGDSLEGLSQSAYMLLQKAYSGGQ